MDKNKLEKQAIGIVAQLFDLAEVPVEKRQQINDKAYDYMLEQLHLHSVSDSKRFEFTNETYLIEGIYQIETNLGRKFEAMYSLNRWFEHKVDIQENEKVIAYYS